MLSIILGRRCEQALKSSHADLISAVASGPRGAGKRWYVSSDFMPHGTIYDGIALDVVQDAQHMAGTGARYTRANPPRRLLTTFACPNQSVAGRLEAAIKKLAAIDKKKLVGKTGAEVRKALLSGRPLRAHVTRVI